MNWNLNLDSLLVGQHEVHTSEGARRSGRITRINWRSKEIDGRTVAEPISLELNNDANDFVTWDSITKIDRLPLFDQEGK